jgi:hypothetical protein
MNPEQTTPDNEPREYKTALVGGTYYEVRRDGHRRIEVPAGFKPDFIGVAPSNPPLRLRTKAAPRNRSR